MPGGRCQHPPSATYWQISYIALPSYAPVAADVSEHHWYRALRESRDRGKEQEGRSICGRGSPFVIEHVERGMGFWLTKCGLEAVGGVLAGVNPTVRLGSAGSIRDAGGGGARG